MIERTEIGGVLLAGGKASRMDFKDKALQRLHGEPLLAHVIAKAAPQVNRLILSVNHNPAHYEFLKLPLVRDIEDAYRGPLVGIYSAMRWYLEQDGCENIKYLACFAADVPEFPRDIIAQLIPALNHSDSAVAYALHQEQAQPLFSLWRLNAETKIRGAIEAGLYGPKLVFDSLGAVPVLIESSVAGCFFNINSQTDLETAELLLPSSNP